MATLSEIRTDVLSDLLRSDLSDEATRAINDAVRDYSSTRFWFNQSRTTTFNTVSSQAFYTSSDSADIPNLVKIDQIVLVDGVNYYDLDADEETNLELLDNGSVANNRPNSYAYFNRQIRLFPKPNGVYSIRVLGLLAPADLAADSDYNVFTLYAEALIRHSAKRRLLAEVLDDEAAASRAANVEQLAFARLQRETTLRNPTPDIICYEPF